MRVMIDFIIIFCVAVPVIALMNIIRIIILQKKTEKKNHEKLMDILTEYQIMAEKNNGSEDKK